MAPDAPGGPADVPFLSRRSAVYARRGMAASSQPLATQAGLSMLAGGGNAADAAVAMAAVLNVTEPCSTGIGGDCFSLFFDASTGRVTALNGSGRSPAALSLDLVRGQGLAETAAFRDPMHAHTATVPGACAGWCDMNARHGSMPLAEVLSPAIALAEDGFPVAPMTAYYWSAAIVPRMTSSPGGWAFLVDGRGPRPGEILRNPGLARTFREVAEGGKTAFYTGPIARDIARAVQEEGGVMSTDDLARHHSTWDEPLSVSYRGMRIWECPPNGQGLVALLALGILEGFDVAGLPASSPERWHLLIECVRLGFADALRHVADPSMSPVPLDRLLADRYTRAQRARINPKRAIARLLPGALAPGSDTVYFCAVDGRGNACSFINSNYMGFGTGIAPRESEGPRAGDSRGFTLQNRGMNFSLEPGHPNALAPSKRPYHTIIPGMITRADGSLYGPFGVMGGFMQPQGHVQIAVGLLDDGLDPQQCLDAPRFCVEPRHPGGLVYLEEGAPSQLAAALSARGHQVRAGISGFERSLFGRGQVIVRRQDGALCAGSDPRADGCAAGF
jgi:gamma-glutamyltranspeptidase / glutathione hydrolase